MPKDDAAFEADLNAADQEFRKATEDELGTSLLVKKAAETRMGRYRLNLDRIAGFGRISGGTEPALESFNQLILPRLKQFEPDDNESPVQTIRGKLEGWDGPFGSAAYAFKSGYLNQLATALATQHAVMQSMAAVMTGLEAVIDQARQQFLDVLKSAAEAISQGGDWFATTDDALAKMSDVFSAADEGIHNTEKGLDEVLVYLTGDFKDDFLPPESVSSDMSAGASPIISSGAAPGISTGVAPGVSSGLAPGVVTGADAGHVPGENADPGDGFSFF